MTQRKVFLNQVQGALCFQPDLSTYYITADRAGIMGNPVCKHNFFTQAYYGLILKKNDIYIVPSMQGNGEYCYSTFI